MSSDFCFGVSSPALSRFPSLICRSFSTTVGLLEWTEYNLNDGQKFNGLERITHSPLFQTLCYILWWGAFWSCLAFE